MSKKSRETAGDVLLELEMVVRKLVNDHGFQWGDILANQYVYLMIHCPDAQEKYLTGGSPEFYYGPHRSESTNEEN